MERSYAFELIDDPTDPAWHGHAELEHRPWWSSRRLQAAFAVVVVAALVAFALAVTHDGDDARATRTLPAEQAKAAAPVEATTPAIPETTTEIPAPVEPAHVDAAPAAGHAGESATAPAHEYQLSPAEVNAYVRAWSRETGSGFGRPGALVGDVDGLGASISAGLEGLALRMNRSLVVISGTRTRAEQEVLYARFQAGTGNLAAVPGTSRHETGEAADVYVDGVALADVPGARQHAAALGLGFPVPGEAWHVERVGLPAS